MIKHFSVLSKQNFTLRGIVTLPDKSGKYPVVINLHGFATSMGGHKSNHVYYARTLASHGIACVRFDFHGNGESDGEFEDMRFSYLLDDVQVVYNWVLEQDWADSDKIILSGFGMGGMVASIVAPKIKPFALILIAPGAGMWFGCRERSKALEMQGIQYGDVAGLKLNHEFNYDLSSHHPFDDAVGYNGHAVILRGSEDKLVDDFICEKYFNLYDGSAEYITVSGANHNFSSVPMKIAIADKVLKFIKNILQY